MCMSIERQRLNGLQDRRLELGGGKSTPTSDADIGPRARLFMHLVEEAVVPTMALEGMSGGRGTQEMIDAQTAQLRVIRRKAVIGGIGTEALALRVKMRVDEIKEEQRERDEDAELEARVRATLTKTDFERQAELGDVPATVVNFGWREGKRPI